MGTRSCEILGYTMMLSWGCATRDGVCAEGLIFTSKKLKTRYKESLLLSITPAGCVGLAVLDSGIMARGLRLSSTRGGDESRRQPPATTVGRAGKQQSEVLARKVRQFIKRP